MTEKSNTREDELQLFADFRETIDQMLEMSEYSVASSSEREMLRLASVRLIGAVDELIEIFRAHDILQTHNAMLTEPCLDLGPYNSSGTFALWTALYSAMHIGNRAFNDPIKEKIARAAQSASIANARSKKNLDSHKTDEMIFDLMRPIRTKHPTTWETKWNDNRVAGIILDNLNENLSAKRMKPLKVDAVRRRIKRIRTSEQRFDKISDA